MPKFSWGRWRISRGEQGGQKLWWMEGRRETRRRQSVVTAAPGLTCRRPQFSAHLFTSLTRPVALIFAMTSVITTYFCLFVSLWAKFVLPPSLSPLSPETWLHLTPFQWKTSTTTKKESSCRGLVFFPTQAWPVLTSTPGSFAMLNTIFRNGRTENREMGEWGRHALNSFCDSELVTHLTLETVKLFSRLDSHSITTLIAPITALFSYVIPIFPLQSTGRIIIYLSILQAKLWVWISHLKREMER